MTEWRNRIVKQGTKQASQFLANPDNWRLHPQIQREAVEGSLNTLGWIQQVVENVQTGHLIDGHERVWQALQNDDAEVPYIQVDLTPQEEAIALASLDPLSALAAPDFEKQRELLQSILDKPMPGLDTRLNQMLSDMKMSIPFGSGAGTRDAGGDHNDQDIWPVIKISVPNEVFERYRAIVADYTGEEWEKFQQLLDKAAPQ